MKAKLWTEEGRLEGGGTREDEDKVRSQISFPNVKPLIEFHCAVNIELREPFSPTDQILMTF